MRPSDEKDSVRSAAERIGFSLSALGENQVERMVNRERLYFRVGLGFDSGKSLMAQVFVYDEEKE